MSRWTVLPLVLMAIFALTGTTSAQTSNPWRVTAVPEAPMPRVQEKHGELRVGIQIGGPQVLQMRYELRIDGETAAAPMPHVAGSLTPCCDGNRVRCSGPVPAGGPGIEVDMPLPANLMVLMDDRAWPFPMPAAHQACQESSTGWWLNSTPLPQPRHVIPVVVIPPVWERGPVMIGGSGGVQRGLHSSCAPLAHGCPIVTSAFPLTQCPTTATSASISRADKLSGTWCRDLGELVITASFTGDELKVCLLTRENGLVIRITLTADYGVSKEGLIHGVVTGVDVDVKRGPDAEEGPSGREVAEFGAELQAFVNCPFSFRIKPTSTGVMVSNLKVATEEMSKKELGLACGMFKPVLDGTIPELKLAKTAAHRGRCEASASLPAAVEVLTQPLPGAVPTMPVPVPPGEVRPARALPAQSPGEQGFRNVGVGRSAAEACPYCPSTSVPMGPPVAWSPPKPANVPPGDFGMMADVFGKMLGSPATGRCESSCHPADVPQTMPPHPPYPVYPATLTNVAPRPITPPPLPGSAARSIVGTWIREVGPLQYVVAITPERITITARAATEFDDGKTVVDGMVLTAEYHLARDGVTVVGLITGVDGRLEGELEGVDVNSLQEELARFQKGLTDKPFAMSLRVHDDSLVIGNVRWPEMSPANGGPSPLTALGGCYSAAGDRPLPKLKPVKVSPLPPAQLPPGPPPYAAGPGLPPLPRPGRVGTPLDALGGSGPLLLQEYSDRIPPPTPRVTEAPALLPPQPLAEISRAGSKDGHKKGKKKKKDTAMDLSVERNPANAPR